MTHKLAALSVVGLFGAGALAVWSVTSRPDASNNTYGGADSFNLKYGPAPKAPRDSISTASPVRSSLTRPIAFEGMAAAPSASAAPPSAKAEASRTVISAKAEAWAQKHAFFSGLIARPARFFLEHSALTSARGLRSFLADKGKVDAYLNAPLTRVALNSPVVAKAVLGNPGVTRAFLASPAMRDPQAVRALVGSPMLRKMLDCPAVQEALADPGVMKSMVSDPQTVAWIAAHPQALAIIAGAVPALGDAFGARKRP